MRKKRSFPIWLAGLAAAALIALAGIAIFMQPGTARAQMPDVVSVSQAADLRSQGAFILDVREPSEWAQFHIPGATLIPLGDLPNRLGEVPRDQKVVVVCRTGHRSAQGRDILRQAGYSLVTSLSGGITAWQAAGEPVAAGG
ncbi:MAG TPA: rhodanese-like domain-containing protein [Anaerolineaceae bacterium]